jgi:hypothetical protein
MAGFIYYIPGGAAGISIDDAKAAGLGYAIEGPITSVGLHGGPDGGNGVLVASAKEASAADLSRPVDRITWRKPIGESAVWFGMLGDAVPTPGELARARQIPGWEVRLADDRLWVIPMARGHAEEDGLCRWFCALPQRSRLGDDGLWAEGDVLPRFASLWQLAERYDRSCREAIAAARAGAGDGQVKATFDFQGIHESAVDALAYNYRIGPAEADLLGILTWDISREILEAVIDWPTLVDWFKKKLSATSPAGASTDAGPPDSTAATGQP